MGAIWTLKDAREQLETLARAAEQGEPQHVALDDGDEVVVLSKRDYDLMSKRPKTFVEHIFDFPKLPDDAQDLFDKRSPEELILAPREIDFDGFDR